MRRFGIAPYAALKSRGRLEGILKDKISTKRASGVNQQSDKGRWLLGIYIGMVANSVVIFFWLPLFFELDPGGGYRVMPGGGGLVSLVICVFTLPYGVVLGIIKVKSAEHTRLKLFAVTLNLMPTLGIMLIILLLAVMGHYPSG